jgi:hypothetical protein
MSDFVYGISQALQSLAPGATWKYNDEDYLTIEWLSDDIKKPSLKQVEKEISRLQELHDMQQQEIANAESAKQAARESALVKLAKYGMTEEEARAVVGL